MVRVDPPDVIELPVPEGLTCVLVHPHVEIETSRARAVVPGAFELSTYVEQSTRLGGLIADCYRGDVDLIGESLEDILIEPHRASLVPGFERVQRAALEAGALGGLLSGAGPSLFALCHPEARADRIETAMVEAFEVSDVEVDSWISPIASKGVRVWNDPEGQQ